MSPSRAPEAGSNQNGRTQGLLLGGFFLVLSAVLGYWWISVRLLEIDEYLSFYTDSQPTIAKVLAVQLHYPISLDPPTYHLLSHFAMKLLGPTPTALRLPALFGFLLFQASAFFFTRRIAGWRPAVVATALPLLTVSFFYAVQGRPYGLLLGAYSMSLACWQTATRGTGRARLAALAGLTIALIVGVTSHFFGVLILVPVCAGELTRTMRRRKADWGTLGAIVVGMASVLTVIPFQRAVSMYRQHYYSTSVSWHIIPQAYAALFLFHHDLPMREQHLFLAALALLVVGIGTGVALRFRNSAGFEPVHEWTALLTLALLPVVGYLFGKAVTHTADVRYVIATLFAVTVLAGVALERPLRSGAVFYAVLALLIWGSIEVPYGHIKDSRAGAAAQLTRFQLSPEAAAALAKDPHRRIYIQSLGDFYFNTYYEPDAGIRSRFTLVYARGAELHWLGHDTNYITAVNMEHFTSLSIRPYSDLLATTDPLVLNYRDGWDWLAKDLEARKVPTAQIGRAMQGDLVQLDINDTPARGH